MEYTITTSSDGDDPPDKERKLSEFGVITFKKRTLNLQVRTVNDSIAGLSVPDDYNIQTLKDNLDKHFRQIAITWNVHKNNTVDFNYDKNNNGYLEAEGIPSKITHDDGTVTTNYNGNEAYMIVDNFSEKSSKFNLYIVKSIIVKGNPAAVGMNVFTRDSFVEYARYDLVPAHEVAHGLLLHHINEEHNFQYGFAIDDEKNLMYTHLSNKSSGRLLIKQWTEIDGIIDHL